MFRLTKRLIYYFKSFFCRFEINWPQTNTDIKNTSEIFHIALNKIFPGRLWPGKNCMPYGQKKLREAMQISFGQGLPRRSLGEDGSSGRKIPAGKCTQAFHSLSVWVGVGLPGRSLVRSLVSG